MADVMNAVQGRVGMGIQPKDSQAPGAPTPSPAAQMTANSLPPGPAATGSGAPTTTAPAPPTPAPTPAPQAGPPAQGSGDDKDVNELFADFKKDPLPDAAKKHDAKQQDEVDAMFSDFKSAAAPAPKDESAWGKLVDSLPESVRLTAANMRAQLGRDPKEQRQAFESMFGTDNVKTVGKDLYFRPDGQGKFTKVNKTVYGGLTDFILGHALQLPGLAANVATQGVTDAATGAAGPLAFAAGGAAGGTANAVVDAGMRGALNLISSQPQDDERESLKASIAKEAGLNAVGAGVLGPVFGAIGKQYAKFKDGLVAAGGEDIGKLAAVRTAFNQFKDVVFPSSTVEGSAQTAMTAVDAIQDRMAKQVGAIKDEVLGLAESQDKKVAMDNTISRVQGILQKNGYPLDKDGFAKIAPPLPGSTSPAMGNQELQSGPLKNTFDQLASYLNRLKRDAAANQGSDMRQVFQDIDNLSRNSRFDISNPTNPEIVNMFRQIRNAASTDRNAAIDQIYKASDSPSKDVWKNAFDEYSHNVDAVTDLQAAFRTPQQRELMVNALNKSKSADKLELLDNFKQVLGEGSKEWNALRGEIYGQIIDNHISDNGVFQAAKFGDYLTSKANQPFLSRLLSKQDQGVLTRMAMESSQINANNALTNPQANFIKDAAAKMIDLLGDKMGVKALFKLTSGNAKVINYLTDDGFMEAYAKAQGPELKQNILNAQRMMNGLRNKMTVVDIPTLGERMASKAQRYVPLAAPGATGALESLMGINRFSPQSASPSPQPVPAPAPSMVQ